jgi:hypothetical protein
MIENPMFIETISWIQPSWHRCSCSLDLMIHDDVILSVVQSKVKNISASGVSVISGPLILQMLVSSLKMDVLLIWPPVEFRWKICAKHVSFKRCLYICWFLEKKCEVVKWKMLLKLLEILIWFYKMRRDKKTNLFL